MQQLTGALSSCWPLLWLVLGHACAVGPVPPEVEAFSREYALARGDVWPIEEKEVELRRVLEARHATPEGLLAYRVPVDDPGPPRALASDALAWSSLWTVAEILRHQASPSDEALASLERCLRGLDHLARVSGTPGLLARTLVPYDEALLKHNPPPRVWLRGRGEHAGLDYTQYLWRADNSMDMVAAWSLAMHLGLRHCRDETLRADLIEDLKHAAHRISDAGYWLTEEDGQRTRWGGVNPDGGWRVLRWCIDFPVDLWPFFDFASGPGALLSVCIARVHDAHCDGPPLMPALIQQGVDELIEDGVYHIFGESDPSNDLIALVAAWAILETDPPPPLREQVRHALRELWLRHRNDRNPLYVALADRYGVHDGDRERWHADAWKTLDTYPMDRRVLPVDWRRLPGVRRRGFTDEHATHAMPFNLLPSSSILWKTDVTRVWRPRGDGSMTHSGADFLLAYWLMEQLR